MENSKYKIRYLPLFEDDLNEIVEYISVKLESSQTANNLVDVVEKAILNRLSAPVAFEPYYSKRDRKNLYYRIYVKNFVVYYVVIEEEDESIMEVRRILYNKRDIVNII